MTEKQEAQFRKMIEYLKELARLCNEVERRVEELEARLTKPAPVEPTSR